MPDGCWVCKWVVCRSLLGLRTEGLCDAVLCVGNGASVEGAWVKVLLLVMSLNSFCLAGSGW